MNRFNLTAPAISLPQLIVLKQNCLAEEQIPNKDGDTTNVFVVVKHSPFNVQLGFLPTYGGPQPDLNCLSFDVKLVYDSPEEKEVDFIKHKPFEFRVKVDPSGTFVNIECRLKVLTSQLEDMFFRLRFLGLDPITKRAIGPQLTAISEPIKVISKPEQLRKNLPTQKRKINDALVHVLDRIENSQSHQKDLLDHLQSQIDHLKCMIQESELTPHKKMRMTDPQELQKEFTLEDTFSLMLKSLENESVESRSQKLKTSLSDLNVTTEDAFEFVDFFNAGLGLPIGQQLFGNGPKQTFFQPSVECRCVHCPHREELLRIEEFYSIEL
eukprot:TRINITY_DN138_c0_g1_i1.p1 TRINITY_DN138_c0_g1~~TRINITY_DN138_c0_g1_i1.p1  ORF type:complete len:325 (-),score=71.47 TRINITY_DN138_c0_g1_i1:114-1088(-)